MMANVEAMENKSDNLRIALKLCLELIEDEPLEPGDEVPFVFDDGVIVLALSETGKLDIHVMASYARIAFKLDLLEDEPCE